MTENIEGSNPTEPEDLNGIRGWLWYFTAGLAISVPIYLYNSYDYFKMIKDYNSFGKAWVVTFIAVSGLLTAIAFAYSFYLIIKRRQLAKSLLFYSLMASAVFAVLSIIFLDQTYSELVSQKLISVEDKQSAVSSYPNEFGRPILYSIVWAIYFKRSKRVRATLIN
jgi:multisubunit Na+/H+ antiporter MnhC subunit